MLWMLGSLSCEPISLVLVPPRYRVHYDGKHHFQRGVEQAEELDPAVNGLMLHIECVVDPGDAQADG